jgi:hypothetical protein
MRSVVTFYGYKLLPNLSVNLSLLIFVVEALDDGVNT